jgi:hypothetical protein
MRSVAVISSLVVAVSVLACNKLFGHEAGRIGDVLLLASGENLGQVTALAVHGGRLYGTSNGTDPTSGPMWSVSTSGGDFRYLAPYNPYTNGAGAVTQMGLDPPLAYFGVGTVPNREYGVWSVALDGGAAIHEIGYYNGQIVAVDPPGMPYLWIGDAYNPGFVAEPKVGANPPGDAIVCDPDVHPPALQVLTDANGNIYWAYNGRYVYDAGAPVIQGVFMAARDIVNRWKTTGCTGYTTLVSGVDVRGIGVDGANVYWSDFSPAIFKLALGGDKPTNISYAVSLPAGDDAPRALVTDGVRVYWVNNTPYVWAIAADGSTSGSAIAIVGPDANRTSITAMALDDQYVYFADSGDSSIWRVRK